MFTTNWYLKEPLPNEFWCQRENIFTAKECKGIIDLVTKKKLLNLTLGLTADKNSNTDVRNSMIGFLPSTNLTEWIFKRIALIINDVNKEYFNYDLTHLESLQFTQYDESYQGFYKRHIDLLYKSSHTRKLSCTIQLTDPSKYEGGDLVIYNEQGSINLNKAQGSGSFFPSWALHEITPVTKGTRYSLVAWVAGPRFK